MEPVTDFGNGTRNLKSDSLDSAANFFSVLNTTYARDGDNYMDKVMEYIDLYLNIVSTCILSVFTLSANIINMMVLVKQGINTCVSLCLVCLSATDFLSTFFGFCAVPPKILMYLNRSPGFDPFAIYFIMVYMSAILYDVSNTLTAFLSLERCLCVCLPLKFKDIFTFWRSVTILVCIYLLCFGLLLPHFLSSGLEMRTTGNSTFLALWLSPDRAAVDVYIDVVHFCQTAVIMTVVFVCTLLMNVSLNRSSKFQGGRDKGSKPCKSPVTNSGRKTAKNSSAAQANSCEDEQASEEKIENISGSLQNSGVDQTEDPKRNRKSIAMTAGKKLKFNSKSKRTATDVKSGKDSITANNDKNTPSSRNLNVMKTVIVLCFICFLCNLSRIIAATATHLEPRLRFGKEYGDWYQLLLSICYVFQILNCSLNIFVYYRFNQSFRKALRHILFCKSDD
ncbi:hypothetical protein RRG08_051740 [Elysia crispata]|uniref:G-protein coupled receptors family 1 profile domain-containing protein n=1 Tax=Elysia crispata TaxID=231223 RepID=A0AAE1BBD1_9GAST|nr:hypothetical protein RRG08_051740 [Elysia crispata]